MPRLFRDRVPAPRLAVAVLGTAAFVSAVLAMVRLTGLGTVANLWQVVGGTLVVLAAAVRWAWRPRRRATSGDLDEAARALTRELGDWWSREARHRGLRSGTELGVRWRTVESAEGDPVEGSIDDLGELLRSGRWRRVVLLGEPGGGKTSAAVLVALRLLESAPDDAPIPLVVPAADWPADLTLTGYLGRTLRTSWPWLAGLRFGSRAADLAHHRLLVVVDGLDEASVTVRQHVLDELSQSTASFVLTCRTWNYEEILRERRTAPIADAVIRLEPAAARDVGRYLTAGLLPAERARWEPLVAELRDRATPVGEALGKPLLASVAAQVYAAPDRDPAELGDRDRFPTARSIEHHLLGSLVQTTYARPRIDDAGRLRDPRYQPDRAARWLGYLAGHMKANNWRTFSWDDLSRSFGALVYFAVATALEVWVLAMAWFGVLPSLFFVPTMSVIVALDRDLHAQDAAIAAALMPLLGAHLGLIGGVFSAAADLRHRSYASDLQGLGTPGRTIGERAYEAFVDRLERPGPISGPLICAGGLWVMTAPVLVAWSGSIADGTWGRWLLVTAAASAAVGLVVLLADLVGIGYPIWVAACAVRGRLPWRPRRFLASAYERGLLHRSGRAYEFRHALLADRLAADHRAR